MKYPPLSRLFKVAIATTGLTLALSSLSITAFTSTPQGLISPISLTPARAIAQQRLRPADFAPQVYERMPDLPLENQYLSQETGEVVPEETLVSRLIRYHVYTRGRPVLYRLDWKLTLADYLGANQGISPNTYPGHDTLQTNPRTQDVEAISQLNRAQRDELVETLTTLFRGESEAADARAEDATPAPEGRRSPALPPLAQPGDAQLLMP